MKRFHPWSRLLNDQRGVTVVLVAILLIPLFGFLALAVDIGLLAVSRNELQDAADAAALAGARQLGKIYQGDEDAGVAPMSYKDQQTYDCGNQITYSGGAVGANDCEEIMAAAKSAGTGNKVFGSALTDATVEVGDFQSDTGTFTQGNGRPTAVFVNVERSSSMNGTISTFIAKVLGTSTISVGAKATASLTGEGKSAPGELKLPIGIPKGRFTGDPDTWCQSNIKFSPPTDTDTCGAWTDFTDSNPSSESVGDILDGSEASPELTANESMVDFNNGKLSDPNFTELLKTFQSEGYDVDADGNPVADTGNPPVPLTEAHPTFDDEYYGKEGNVFNPTTDTQLTYPCPVNGNCAGPPRYRHRWDASVIVYDSIVDCSPTIPYKILGFAQIMVKDVLEAPDKTVVGEILCNYVSPDDSRGSGGSYGKLGSIPGLVQPQNDPYTNNP